MFLSSLRATVGGLLLVVLLVAWPSTATASPGTGEPSHEVGEGPEAAAVEVQYTFTVEQRGAVEADFAAFEATVGATLGDDRGWQRSGIALQPVASGGHFSVILASPAAVDAAHDVCSPEFSCRVGDEVLINDLRWRTATPAWTGGLEEYRQYVTNHEVGHWLGLGHESCPAAAEPAPVMLQQSIDLEGCAPNGWPLQSELEAVAAIHGTVPREPEPESAGDVPVIGDWNGDGTTTPGIIRGRTWHLRNDTSSGPADIRFTYGRAGDTFLAGDWNGDGTTTPGIIRGRTWHLRNDTSSGPADIRFTYGRAG